MFSFYLDFYASSVSFIKSIDFVVCISGRGIQREIAGFELLTKSYKKSSCWVILRIFYLLCIYKKEERGRGRFPVLSLPADPQNIFVVKYHNFLHNSYRNLIKKLTLCSVHKCINLLSCCPVNDFVGFYHSN